VVAGERTFANIQPPLALDLLQSLSGYVQSSLRYPPY
jgi:hypothetical protein